MNVAHKEPHQNLDAAARKLTINLARSRCDKFEVRSCEIKSSAFSNRISFQNRTSIDDVFHHKIASQLNDCLLRLRDGTKSVSIPTLVLEVPGVTLANARVNSSTTPEGDAQIIVEFKFFVGGINNVFLSNIGFDDATNDLAAGLSVKVLADLALPFLNVCESYKSNVISSQAGFTEFMAGLSERAQEFRFQVELLKRFADAKEKSSPPSILERSVSSDR